MARPEGVVRCESRSSACGVRAPVRGRSTSATGVTPRACRSPWATNRRSSSTWAPGCGPSVASSKSARHRDEPIEMTALLTHLHWDHIIGLPFCTPLLSFGTRMDVYGPPQVGGTLHDVIDRVVIPPFFPVQVKELHGSIDFHEVEEDDFAIGSAKIRVRRVPHVGTTLGFRIEADGASVAFVSDHQTPDDRASGGIERARVVRRRRSPHPRRAVHRRGVRGRSPPGVIRRSGTPFTWRPRPGHADCRLFHHDPDHTDDILDRLVEKAGCAPGASRLEAVSAAAEGIVRRSRPSVTPVDEVAATGRNGGRRRTVRHGPLPRGHGSLRHRGDSHHGHGGRGPRGIHVPGLRLAVVGAASRGPGARARTPPAGPASPRPAPSASTSWPRTKKPCAGTSPCPAGTSSPAWAGVSAATGRRLLDGVLAWLECALVATHDAGDHELVIGNVNDMGVTRGRPLVYYRGGFGRFEP